MEERVLGGLLVGGASRRMGRAKARVEVGGLALAVRGVKALEPLVEEVVLLGDGPTPGELRDLRRIPDAPLAGGGAGPLAALLGALRGERAAWVIVACDLPGVRPEAVRWILGQRRPGRVAVLPRATEGGPVEPLLAIYEPTALPLLEELAAAGRRGPRHLAGRPGVASPVVPGPLADAWFDVDTPEELERARDRRSAADRRRSREGSGPP